jgi:hypothetical protein
MDWQYDKASLEIPLPSFTLENLKSQYFKPVFFLIYDLSPGL